MNKKTIIIVTIAIVAIVALVLILSLVSNSNYTDALSSTQIYNGVADSFTTEKGVKILDDDVILEFTDDDLPYLKDYIVVKANYTKNINEVGIFRVESGKANELKKIIEQYVEETQQIYRAMDYFPEEVEKIDFATVKVFGNYVIYSFLNEKDTEAFYKAIENLVNE